MDQIVRCSDGLVVKVRHEPEKPKEPDKSKELRKERWLKIIDSTNS